MDDDQMYRALHGKDARFDGWFFVGVTSTGIYCRPSCPAITPKRKNVRFYGTAAAAQLAGFRACKRCRPDAVPGSPEWNVRGDLVARAMRLIADGVVDREGVNGLASRLGYTERHLSRQLVAELGAGPLAIARAKRAQTARVLIETTGVPMAEVAFASGFASVRQFNDTIREVFALTPTQLRHSASKKALVVADGILSLRLPFRKPLAAGRLFDFLQKRGIPGVEDGSESQYTRTLSLAHGSGTAELRSDGVEKGWIICNLYLDDLRDLSAAVERCRRLLDLDCDPVAIKDALCDDDRLKRIVRGLPGLRIPGHVDGWELAMRAVLGQQVSIGAARRQAQRLTERLGKPLTSPRGPLTHHFPRAEVIAEAGDEDLPMPSSRRRALRLLATAIAEGKISLDAGSDREATAARLLKIPGIGSWTVAYIRMRALSDPDVFMPTDLGVRRALESMKLPSDQRSANQISQAWSPWRSYALQYLWARIEFESKPRARRAAT